MGGFIKRVKGFTLIELLVVVAIIGILAAIIIINVAGAKARAVDSKVQASLVGSQKIVLQCINSGGAPIIRSKTAGAGKTTGDTTICTNLPAEETPITENWPTMPTEKGTTGLPWEYNNGAPYSNTTNTFGFMVAPKDKVLPRIVCNQNGCKGP